jgi:hypothetical protein
VELLPFVVIRQGYVHFRLRDVADILFLRTVVCKWQDGDQVLPCNKRMNIFLDLTEIAVGTFSLREI